MSRLILAYDTKIYEAVRDKDALAVCTDCDLLNNYSYHPEVIEKHSPCIKICSKLESLVEDRIIKFVELNK